MIISKTLRFFLKKKSTNLRYSVLKIETIIQPKGSILLCPGGVAFIDVHGKILFYHLYTNILKICSLSDPCQSWFVCQTF